MIKLIPCVVGRSVPFHCKSAASFWLRSSGWARVGGVGSSFDAWILGNQFANWVPIPGKEPEGMVVISLRRGV